LEAEPLPDRLAFAVGTNDSTFADHGMRWDNWGKNGHYAPIELAARSLAACVTFAAGWGTGSGIPLCSTSQSQQMVPTRLVAATMGGIDLGEFGTQQKNLG